MLYSFVHKLFVIMQILSFNFLIYTFAGIWRPVEWSSTGIKLLYNVFTSIVLFLEYFLMLTQFMDIIFIKNIDDFVMNSLMFASVIAVICKATLVVIRRNAIINLVQILLTAPCKPRDRDEEVIQTKFDKFIRSVCTSGYQLLSKYRSLYVQYINFLYFLHLQIMVDKIYTFGDEFSYGCNNKISAKRYTRSITL